MFTRTRGADVTITDVTIKKKKKNQIGKKKGTGNVNDVMPRSDGLRIWELEKQKKTKNS